MPAPIDDRALVTAAQGADRDALEQLLRRHHDRIRAVCRRITGNDADAADATQEALILIVRNLGSFDGRSSFGTWVYRIATNASLDELRRRRRRPILAGRNREPDRRVPTEPVDVHSHQHPDRIADRLALDTALMALPEDFRVPVVLRDVGDLDYAEIAHVLDVPIGTVKSRIARGRSMLAAQISRTTGNQTGPNDRPTHTS